MNELTRWIVGIMIGFIVGSYTYTYSAVDTLETRITRQLDIIERKVDQVITRQWEQTHK